MTIILPLIEEVITPGEMLEVEKFLADFDYKNQNLKVRTGQITISVSKTAGLALLAAILAAALAMILGKADILTEVLEDEETKTRRRRKLRLHLCVKTLMGILSDAKKEIDEGYAFNRALETSDKIKRKVRRYQSRQ